MTELIRRNITLEPEDYTTVRSHADTWGQSFSAALRLIIREWQLLKRQTHELNQSDGHAETRPPTLLT